MTPPSRSSLHIRRLDDLDDPGLLAGFTSGDADLDEFLRDDAAKYHASGLATVYVAQDVASATIVGFIAVQTDAVELKSPEKKRIKLPSQGPRMIPAIKVGRLAIHTNSQRTGTGTALMRLAWDIAHVVAEHAGCRLLTVDAKQQSVAFYERLGFRPHKGQDSGLDRLAMWLDITKDAPWAQ